MRRSSGYFALFALGGLLVWRNRYRIQQFLEAQGVSLPLDTSSIPNTIRSGFAKVSGSIENQVNAIESTESDAQISKAV